MLERMAPLMERLLKAMGVEDGPPLAHPSTPPERVRPSLAHDALIAILNPETGKLWDSTGVWFVVQGGLLVELAHEGRLAVTGTDEQACARVVDPHPLGDPELDSALLRVRDMDGKRVTKQVAVMPGVTTMLERLVADGELIEEKQKRLGLFPVRRHRPTSAAGRDQVVASVRSALLGESIPDNRTALLIAIIRLGAPLKLFVPRRHVKDAERRATESYERLGEAERAMLLAVGLAKIKADSSSGGGGNV